MAAALFTEPRFNDDDAAREHLEALRWPNGAVCPHCGGADRQSKLEGVSHRPGLYFCGHCRSQYTVTVGSVFERSKVPLHKWVLATHLICSSKKGISSHQLHRTLGVTYKTAWFMSHRIREAMNIEPEGQLGGGNEPVEVDETFASPCLSPYATPAGFTRSFDVARFRIPPGRTIAAHSAHHQTQVSFPRRRHSWPTPTQHPQSGTSMGFSASVDSTRQSLAKDPLILARIDKAKQQKTPPAPPPAPPGVP